MLFIYLFMILFSSFLLFHFTFSWHFVDVPCGGIFDPFIYISQNVLYVSDLFTYIMIVKYMINKSLNQTVSL